MNQTTIRGSSISVTWRSQRCAVRVEHFMFTRGGNLGFRVAKHVHRPLGVRGGCWDESARSSERGREDPPVRDDLSGFRISRRKP